jgi:hypothetical protein
MSKGTTPIEDLRRLLAYVRDDDGETIRGTRAPTTSIL